MEMVGHTYAELNSLVALRVATAGNTRPSMPSSLLK